ncbi:hypothetical protein AN644_00705 [Candidatus Epulonipiscium fishelsonii]|nr:hypothetical protein AN644_00705 [Epulopiscium sp. SCG-C06WGA-EpuloA1]
MSSVIKRSNIIIGKNMVTLNYNNKKLPPKPFFQENYKNTEDEFVEAQYGASDDEENYEDDYEDDYENDEDYENDYKGNKEQAAEDILVKARKEANEIIEQAYIQAEADRLKLEEDIKKQAQQEIEKLDIMEQEAHKKADEILQKANQEKLAMLGNLEPDVTNVISNLLRHIIGYEIKHEIKWLSYLVKHMLQQQSLIKPFEVHVSEELYEKLNQTEIDKVESLSKGLKVIPAPYLQDDDIVIQTDMGEISYNITEGMEKVIKDLEMVNSIEVNK